MIPSAPTDGEYLWDEASERWVALVKDDLGHPDVEASVQGASDA